MAFVISDTRFGNHNQLNLDQHSLESALSDILSNRGIDQLILFAEARFENSHHQKLDGLTLLKHLLVDPKRKFYKIPIILIHVTPYEYILNQEADNLIIMAPNIMRFRWKADWLKGLPDFQIKDSTNLSFQYFKKFVVYTHADAQYSEHDARNELGAKKLLQEWYCDFSNSELPLHYKKHIFLERIKSYLFSENDKQKFIEQRKGVRKVLILEDEEEKWGPVFQTLLPGKYNLYSDYREAIDYLNDVKKEIKTVFETYSKDFYNEGYTEQRIPCESNSFIEQISSIWKYDMIICDLNFKTKSSWYEGIDFIKLIRSFDPYIPIIVFTASKKNDSFQRLKKYKANISGVFVKGVDSLSKLTFLITDNKLSDKHYDLQWRTKLNLHRYWTKSLFYYFDYDSYEFKVCEIGRQVSILMVLNKLHELMKPESEHSTTFKNYIIDNIQVGDNWHKVLGELFSFFLIPEIKLQYPKHFDSETHYKLNDKTNFFKNENNFRGLRNKIYHPANKNISLNTDLSESFYYYLFDFLDWLINPLQTQEVRKMLECKK